MHTDYIDNYLEEVKEIADKSDRGELCRLAQYIDRLTGRLFILGVGGSAANASHAVNDFRKILEIESYAPTDNVAELTARVNDDGWDTTMNRWLETSQLNKEDALLVFSVGGGSEHTSLNLLEAMKLGKKIGCKIFSVVSRGGGAARELSDCCILIPVIDEERITPHAEEWQGIVWHMIVSCVADTTTTLTFEHSPWRTDFRTK